MLKLVLLLAGAVALAIALAPRLLTALSWVLAFFILLMLGDLLLRGWERRRREAR